MKKLKVFLRYAMVASLLLIGVLYLVDPEVFNGKSLKQWIDSNAEYVKPVYIAVCLAKALTLLPSTPFVIAGMLLFPDEPEFVLLIALSQVALTATFHYYFSKWLEFDRVIKEKYSDKLDYVSGKMKRYGFGIVFVWAITPVVPSDVIYYVAGTTNMRFLNFLSAIMLGATVLFSVYIYAGQSFFQWLLNMS